MANLRRIDESLAAFSEIQSKQPQPSRPRITENEQIAKCRQDIEKVLADEKYDFSGIPPKDLDVIIGIAARRKAVADYKALQSYCHQQGWDDPEPVRKSETGIILMGIPGCGKTMLLSLLNKARALPTICGEVSIALVATSGGIDSVFKKYREIETGDVCLDDVGLTGDIKSYGNSNLMDKILLYRYEQWYNFKYTTFITTNICSYQDFVKRYCVQIADRVFEMCYHVIITGGSKRVSAKVRLQ